jgi:hypothetical protein
MFKTSLIWGKYEHPKFKTIKVPIFGLPFGSPTLGGPGKKCHLDVAPTENHKIYYKEGSCASSQRLQVV